jgi:uncharacterized protein
MSAQDVVDVIESDSGAMKVLRATADLGLPDWWIGAGFVRNRVWDAISNLPGSPERDVDVAYFDPEKLDPDEDARVEAEAMVALPGVPWEIRNQARMHLRNGDEPYTSALDAISHWPETATCVAVTLHGDSVRLVCSHGLADLVGMVVRPSPAFNNAAGRAKVQRRVEVKGWLDRWPDCGWKSSARAKRSKGSPAGRPLLGKIARRSARGRRHERTSRGGDRLVLPLSDHEPHGGAAGAAVGRG